ncbi:MAG: serine hydrolase domain-containing protein [Hypericibacter sp.]
MGGLKRAAIWGLGLTWLLMGAGLPAHADEFPVGDKGSMWADPYLIGSYRHMGDIYASRRVPRSGPVSELPAGEPLTIDSFPVGGVAMSLEDYVARARTTGLIVLKDGKVVLERYWHGADATSRFASWSVAKSFVSTLVGFAVADGLIKSVEDPVTDYLPELQGSGYDGVPIKAILQMSSGVAFNEDYESSASDALILWNQVLQYNKRTFSDFAARSKREVEPYAKFNYKGLDSVVLGMLVARVTGKNLSTDLAEKIWGPLGMEDDASWLLEDRSDKALEAPFCCLNARLRDYARFGQFMLQGGAWDGRQLLPASWIAEATRPDRSQVEFGALYPGTSLGYQYQWWVLQGSDRAFSAEGVNGQFIYVNPAKQLVIVMTSVWPQFWDNRLAKESFALFDAIGAALPD